MTHDELLALLTRSRRVLERHPPMQIFMREEDAAGFKECTSLLDDLIYGIDPGKGPTAINGVEAAALELHIAEVSQYEFDIA